MIDLDALESIERHMSARPWVRNGTHIESPQLAAATPWVVASTGTPGDLAEAAAIVTMRNALPDLVAELRVARAVVAALTGDNYRFLSDRTKLALDAYDEATK